MKWKFIIAIIISVITMNCTTNMMLVVNKNPLPEGIKINSKPIFKDKITLVIARKGADRKSVV